MYYFAFIYSPFQIDEFEETSANSIDGLYQYVNSYVNGTASDHIHI